MLTQLKYILVSFLIVLPTQSRLWAQEADSNIKYEVYNGFLAEVVEMSCSCEMPKQIPIKKVLNTNLFNLKCAVGDLQENLILEVKSAESTVENTVKLTGTTDKKSYFSDWKISLENNTISGIIYAYGKFDSVDFKLVLDSTISKVDVIKLSHQNCKYSIVKTTNNQELAPLPKDTIFNCITLKNKRGTAGVEHFFAENGYAILQTKEIDFIRSIHIPQNLNDRHKKLLKKLLIQSTNFYVYTDNQTAYKDSINQLSTQSNIDKIVKLHANNEQEKLFNQPNEKAVNYFKNMVNLSHSASDIIAIDDKILSICFDTHEYNGMTQGNTRISCKTIDLADEKFLPLEGIFKSGTICKLNELLLKYTGIFAKENAIAMHLDLLSDCELSSFETDLPNSYCLSKKGLIIVQPKYSVFPGYIGPTAITIPKEALKKLVKENSTAWQFWFESE